MTLPRKILYVTGTRADFGLMVSTLRQIEAHPGLELQVAVTGMHLSADCGMTVHEIEDAGFPIVARVPTQVDARTAAAMSRGIGETLVGLTNVMQACKPDLVLLIGDRGEMMAGAIAALHMAVPAVHLHGGERSGTVDEPIRHALTKLSHWHLVATEESRDRVIRMGERPEHVWVTGAPSLDGLAQQGELPRADVLAALGLEGDTRYALVLFHPVVQEQGNAFAQTLALLDAVRQTLLAQGITVLWLEPNADAGSADILRALDAKTVRRITHLPRPLYVAALRHAEILVGNSSSGIIEAATFGTAVVNVGHRQRARQRNFNTIDCSNVTTAISSAITQSLAQGRYPSNNLYGDGHSGQRIVDLLAFQPIATDLLDKVNTY